MLLPVDSEIASLLLALRQKMRPDKEDLREREDSTVPFCHHKMTNVVGKPEIKELFRRIIVMSKLMVSHVQPGHH